MDRLLGDGLRVAIKRGMGLNRDAPLLSFLPIVNRLEQSCASDCHFLDEFPGQLVLRPFRVLGDHLLNPIPPQVYLLIDDLHNNRGIGRGSYRAMFDGVGQLLEGSGVVPEIGRSGGYRLVERAFVFGIHVRYPLRCGFLPSCVGRGESRPHNNHTDSRAQATCPASPSVIADPFPPNSA